MSTLITNGYVVNPAGKSGDIDILIKDGKVANMVPTPSGLDGDYLIDAKGWCVAPGLVDTHVHFRDPGQTHKEDIYSGADAAAHGGYTSVVMMANTSPPIDNVETLSYALERGANTQINIEACANVTVGMEGKKLTDMEALVKAGAVGFTDDGKPIQDAGLVKEAMIRAKELGVPISFHEEDPRFITTPGYNASDVIREGIGIEGADRKAEWTMIERDAALAAETGAEIVIQHISTKEGVDIIRDYRSDGYTNIHAEATPHHFTLTEDDVLKHRTLAKMNPPLRTERDRIAIVEGLLDGTIELVSTDHAPHTAEEKNWPLDKAPSGIIGLETAFGLTLEEILYIPNISSPNYRWLEDVIKRMSVNPARIYGLRAGIIKTDAPADLIVFDPNARRVIREEEFASKAKNSPFIGRTVRGKIKYTICNGKIVYSNAWRKWKNSR